MQRVLWAMLLVAAFVVQPFYARSVSAGNPPGWFVKRVGANLRMKGQAFRFAGSNNYYLMYKSQAMVDDVLETASASNFTVMRIWGSLDIGNQDGSNSIQGKADGVYLQYWNGSAPAYNDGEDGLKRLDYVIYKAGQQGIKVVIPFVNNWSAFGGMDQYVRWRGGQYHDGFYTDPLIRQWYKNWIKHLLNHWNPYTGLQYKNDPTIMTWELGNEPRCKGSGNYPTSAGCTTATLISWADDVSRYIKSIDDKHLVSVGDEGFYCVPGSSDWTENCNEGVDTVAFIRLEKIDVMSFHLYPDHWGKDAAWGTQWIERHIADAKAVGKPVMLGEYGWQEKSTRNVVFKEWTDTFFAQGGHGALYWILSGREDNGAYYADYDGFTVYCPSPVCLMLGNFAQMMNNRTAMEFAPVADQDTAITDFETPITLFPADNDVTYGGASLVLESIDLNPATPELDVSVAVYGGTFALQPDFSVLFTPDSGFSGKSQASYTITDSLGRLSNAADLVITVKPSATGAQMLYSFETGTEGWASANWQSNAGTTEQSTDFATDGSYGLKITALDGGWFGLNIPTPLDLTGKSFVKLDVQTGGVGTSMNVALQVTDSWTWCEASWLWINPNTTATVEVNLNTLSCGVTDWHSVKAIYVYTSPNGVYYLDAVRAE